MVESESEHQRRLAGHVTADLRAHDGSRAVLVIDGLSVATDTASSTALATAPCGQVLSIPWIAPSMDFSGRSESSLKHT